MPAGFAPYTRTATFTRESVPEREHRVALSGDATFYIELWRRS
jgi:hypothetical protein